MNIELSDDQNSLTVDGVEYVADDGSSCSGCEFELSRGGDCKFNHYPFSDSGVERTCTDTTRKDKRLIVWRIKKDTMIHKKESTQHKHYDLIVSWANDPSQPVWVWQVALSTWVTCMPLWNEDMIYALGEQPIAPPVKMVTYKNGTLEFPEPIKNPGSGKTYYFVYTAGVRQGVYGSNCEQVEFRNQGKIQLTEAGALKQHRAYVELITTQTSQWD